MDMPKALGIVYDSMVTVLEIMAIRGQCPLK